MLMELDLRQQVEGSTGPQGLRWLTLALRMHPCLYSLFSRGVVKVSVTPWAAHLCRQRSRGDSVPHASLLTCRFNGTLEGTHCLLSG